MAQTATHTRPVREDDMVPRALIRAVLALVLICLALVSWAVATDRPLESTPPDAPLIAERLVYLSGDLTGSARVLDANGLLIADLGPEEGGFIAGVQRVLDRERAKHGQPLTGPVLLQLREGNRLSLLDPSTGWSAELMGFGATNTRAFARLLVQP